MNDHDHRLEDSVILCRIKTGETALYRILMERYQGKVMRILAGRIPFQDAEEVLQETFIRAFQFLPRYVPEKPLEHWLSRIAVNCCYDYWRKTARRREKPESALETFQKHWLEKTAASMTREEMESLASAEEAREVLELALSKIDPESRMVLTLTFFDGYSLKETSQMMGWSLAKTKIRSFRGKKALRKIITRMLGD